MSPPATHPLGPRLLATGVATLLLSFAAPAAAQTPDPNTSDVTAAPLSVPADGATASTITVTVRDSANNPLPGHSVVVSSDLGAISPTPATDVGDGTYTATLTSLNAGTATVTAQVDGSIDITNDATVEFTATALQFFTQPTDTDANATITPPVRVEAIDGAGARVTSFTGTVDIGIGTNPAGGTLSGSTSDIASNGVAVFNDLSIDQVGNGYTLVATSAPLSSDTSQLFNITLPATATELRFGQQPTDTPAGSTITPAITVRATNSAGDTDTGFVGTITIDIQNNPSGGSLLGTTSQPAVNGMATFNDLSINNPGTGYTLQATSGLLTPDTSDLFDIGPATATELRFLQQPTTTVVNQAITPAVTVAATDGTGATDTNFTGTITVAILSNPGGGTLSGTLSRTAVGGVATFNDLSINNPGTGYTLQATSGGLTPDTSSLFNITAAPATELRFNVQPSDTQVRQTIAPPITVRATDGTGTTDPNFTGTITVAILNNPGGGTLSGTLSQPAVNGVATFNNLSINQGGNGYTLRATSAPALTPGTSLGFDIFGPSTANSTITANPTRILANGTSTSTITVQLIDTSPSGGDPITTCGDVVNLFSTAGTMSSNPVMNCSNGVYTGTLTSGTSIVTATISGTVNALGNISDTATVRFGATRLIFGQQPTDTDAQATITPAVTVRAVDGSGTLDGTFTGSVTIAIGSNPSGGTLSGTTTVSAVGGIATFPTLSIDAVGNGYTLTANSIGLTGATSSSFDITLPAAVALEFVQQPTDEAAGVSISPAVTVRAVNGLGDTDTNFTGTISVAIQNNPGGGTLSGTTSIGAVNGVVTFSTLSIDAAANGYTLQATGGGLTPDTSNPFDIVPGPPSGATSEITAVPPDITADGISTATVTVRLRDALGNDLTSGGDNVVLATTAGSLGPATDVGNGTYTATLTSSTTAETATITGTVNGNAIADDATVNFLPGGAGALEFVQQPTTTASGSTISPAVTVRAVDANMNTDTSFNGNITLTIGTNPSGGTLSGTTTVAAVSGVATFSNLSIDLTGAGYTLIAQAAGLGGDESTAFDRRSPSSSSTPTGIR
jgi:hypothetical protein